ncbi:MAG TPA: UrcA family protein [Sphingomicrobium sp.]|nr:UrcA family protein [Sphingomicrobium sp.]
MTRFNSRMSARILAVAAILAGPSASEAEVVVEAPPATRIVQVNSADLASPGGLTALHRRIRLAASEACREENRGPIGTSYHYRHACYSGSLRDAMKQLRELRARLARHADADAQLAIAIRSR